MNIYIHEAFLEERTGRAKRMQMIGFFCILASFLLSLGSFFPQTTFLIFLAYPFLLVGFPIWTLARGTLRRLASAPRADSLLNAEVKGLNNKYSLHHYARVNDVWVPHMLISPSGIIVLATSEAVGPISCRGSEKGDRWSAQSNFLDRMTGAKPSIGNPTVELDAAVAAARTLLTGIGKPDVPVTGVAVFMRNPDISVEGCTYQAVPLNETKLAIRDIETALSGDREGKQAVNSILTADDRRRLDRTLAPETVTLPAKPAPARK